MGEQAMAILMELVRQFPVVILTLGVGWYFMRYISKQHARELEARNAEIARLIEQLNKFDRLEAERNTYYQRFLDAVLQQKDAGGSEKKPPQKPKG